MFKRVQECTSELRVRATAQSRSLGIEKLEARLVLASDLEFFGSLSVDYASFESDSILVRLEDPGLDATSWEAIPGTTLAAPLDKLPHVRQVDLGSGVSVEHAIGLYEQLPFVAYAEPNYRIQLAVEPDDPRYDELWGLHNVGQTGGVEDIDIDAPEAWEVTTGSPSTVVAVIDTGVDYTHPDLAGNIWVNQAEQNGLPGIDDDGNGYVDDIHGYDFFNRDGDPVDDNNHGTHVAGTIGAVGDDGFGVAGVNWDVQIMALKFLNARGSGSVGAAIEALNYAVANGASISNNSWGEYNFSQALHDAIVDADRAGHIFVAAAGNGNFVGNPVNNDALPFYPASYQVDNVVSVAAIDHAGNIAEFSNYGAQSVDLGAPGVGILSTTVGGGYDAFSGTSMATPHVAGVTALVRGLYPDWTHHEVIAQVVGTTDPLAALSGVTVTGGRVNAAAAVGNPEALGPEVLAFDGPRPIASGASVVDFGTSPPGSPVERLIGIRNVGTETLIIGEVLGVPAGFTLLAGPGSNALAPGEQTSFTLRLDALAKGSYGGQLSIATNDADENPLLIDIAGEVDFVPLYLDNGDEGYTTQGDWVLWSDQGFRGDVQESFPGDGSDVARWTFSNLAPGVYEVSATWTEHPNRASDAPYRIFDNNDPVAAIRIDQQSSPDDIFDNGTAWEVLGPNVAFTGDTLTVELSSDADGRLNADGVRVHRVDDLPSGPLLAVVGEDQTIVDGETSVDFGQTMVGQPLTHTFSVRNSGLSSIDLSGPIGVPAGFVVIDDFTPTTLGPGESTSFTLALDSVLPGSFGGLVTFGTDDPSLGQFEFVVSGQVDLPPMLIDNGDPGFSVVGEWTAWGNQGFAGDVHESFPGTGDDVASWLFADLPSGRYQVSATWTREFNRATNARYQLFVGSASIASVEVDQTVAPSQYWDQGVYWDNLGAAVAVTGGLLEVRLADDANGRLNADAVLLRRVGDLASGPEIEVSASGQSVAPGGTFDLGVTPPGRPLEQVFTIRNTGTEPLILEGPVTAPPGFEVSSAPSAATIPSGGAASFTLLLLESGAGQYGGVVSIPTNDPQNGLFSFSISVLVEDQPIVIDNGDPGFSTSGEWLRWTGQGFDSDVHESLPGAGQDIATWEFTGLSPGRYNVAATWSTNSNRASDAPFSVVDRETTVASTRVDQKQAPGGFEADGALWEMIAANVTVLGDTISVMLNDDADGRLNADAVRIERIGGLSDGADAQILSSFGEVSEDGTFDMGRTLLGVPVSETFVVRNSGTASIGVSPPATLPGGFLLAEGFSTTSLAPGQSVSFTITLDAQNEDRFAGEILLPVSGTSVDSLRFVVEGLVAPAPQIVDNGDAGFATVGEWTRWAGQGHAGDVHESFPGTGADVASWTFGDLLPGSYRVAATWTSWLNRASDASYKISDGTVQIGSATVNQQLLPREFFADGTWWHELGEFDTNDVLVVQLGDQANGRLNADAVRVEFLRPLASSFDSDVDSDGDVDVADALAIQRGLDNGLADSAPLEWITAQSQLWDAWEADFGGLAAPLTALGSGTTVLEEPESEAILASSLLNAFTYGVLPAARQEKHAVAADAVFEQHSDVIDSADPLLGSLETAFNAEELFGLDDEPAPSLRESPGNDWDSEQLVAVKPTVHDLHALKPIRRHRI